MLAKKKSEHNLALHGFRVVSLSLSLSPSLFPFSLKFSLCPSDNLTVPGCTLSGSKVIISDTFHKVGDLVGMIISVIALKYSKGERNVK